MWYSNFKAQYAFQCRDLQRCNVVLRYVYCIKAVGFLRCCISSDARFRGVYKLVYLLRQCEKGRTGSRNVRDVLGLALLARELVDVYIEVVEWGENRVLRLKR